MLASTRLHLSEQQQTFACHAEDVELLVAGEGVYLRLLRSTTNTLIVAPVFEEVNEQMSAVRGRPRAAMGNATAPEYRDAFPSDDVSVGDGGTLSESHLKGGVLSRVRCFRCTGYCARRVRSARSTRESERYRTGGRVEYRPAVTRFLSFVISHKPSPVGRSSSNGEVTPEPRVLSWECRVLFLEAKHRYPSSKVEGCHATVDAGRPGTSFGRCPPGGVELMSELKASPYDITLLRSENSMCVCRGMGFVSIGGRKWIHHRIMRGAPCFRLLNTHIVFRSVPPGRVALEPRLPQ